MFAFTTTNAPTPLSIRLKNYTLVFSGNMVQFDIPVSDLPPPACDFTGAAFHQLNHVAGVIKIDKNTKQVDGRDLVNLDWIKENDVELEFIVNIGITITADYRIIRCNSSFALKEVNIEDEEYSKFSDNKEDRIVLLKKLLKTAQETFETANFLTGKGASFQFDTVFEFQS